jgi:hypothetical protein
MNQPVSLIPLSWGRDRRRRQHPDDPWWPYANQEEYQAACDAVEQMLGDRFTGEGRVMRAYCKTLLVQSRCLSLNDLQRRSSIELRHEPRGGRKTIAALLRYFPEWEG